MAVRTQPGSTALEVTPNGPASWATARASPMTPCLEAVYALPERSANVAFGGRYRNRLFMTASHSLYSLYVNTQGVKGG